MFDKGRRPGTIRFTIRPAGGVKRVEVAGEFSNWQPVRMRRRKDGSYEATVDSSGDSCQYKFLIDGRWVPDPENKIWALNSYGTLNSVAELSAGGAEDGQRAGSGR